MYEPENRPLLTAGITTQNVQLSLDKLTVVGSFRNPDKAMKQISQWPDTERDTLAKFPYKYNIYTTSRTVLQLAEKSSPVQPVRIEFNPNDKDQLATGTFLLSLMKRKRPTRIDYALDYKGIDLSDWLMATTRARSTCSFNSSSGKLETLYLGSKDSDDRYRIYNKAKEQKIDDLDWWRIEQQHRLKPDQTWQLLLPFDDLYLVKPNKHLATQDRLVLDGLHRNPEYWGNLTRRIREKYRSLVKDPVMTRLDPWPQTAYFDKAQPIINQLTEFLKD